MNYKWLAVLIYCCLSLNACAGRATQTANRMENGESSEEKVESKENAAMNSAEKVESNKPETTESQTGQPRTVRDFFNLLPQKYFPLESCDPAKDKNCEKARREYVKNYLEVEDTKNGYWESGCDGAQACLTMALFKRPDGNYIVGVQTLQEIDEDNYFLEYRNGKWSDVSSQIVPEYSKDKRYKLPHYGTTVEVFSTKLVEKGADYEIRDRDKKIYALEWKDGKFIRQK